MGLQRGRNVAGLTGLIDLPNLGSGVKFYANIVRWNTRQTGQTRPRQGRGSTKYARARWMLSGGSGGCSGDLQTSGWPEPDAWQGQEGTITVQVDTSKTITIPMIVTVYDISFDTTKKIPDDIPKANFAWDCTGPMVFAGWSGGSQPSATDPSKSDQIQWQGSSKSIDPSGLLTAATRRIDIWGALTDSDAAEQTKLLAVISAAAAPLTTPHDAKLRNSTFERDAIDGGTILETWGLTTTQEDEENAGSLINDDSSDLEDSKTITLIQVSSTPTPPSLPTGLKLDHTDTVERNDSRFRHTFNYARRTKQEAIEMDGSPQEIDSSSLGDKWTFTLVKASSTPAPPSTPDGYVLRDTLIIQRHAASTGQKWIHTYKYTRVTRAKEIEFEGTRLQTSETDIGNVSTIRIISNDEPSTPDPLAYSITGKIISTDAQQLTTTQGAYNGYWQYTYTVAANDRQDEIVNQGLRIFDPASIGNEESIYSLTQTSTPTSPAPTPSNADLKLTRRQGRRLQVMPEIWEWRWDFARNTKEDELEHTARAVDPNNFGESEKIPVLHTSGSSSPGTPSPTNTTQLVGYDVQRLCVASGSFTGLWLWVFLFGPTTKKQEIEQQGGKSTDPQALEDDDVQTLTNTSSTDPGAPAARISGQVLILTQARIIQNTPLKWEFKYVYGWRTSTGKLVGEHTRTMVDVSALESEATTAERWLVSGGAPGTPTLAGYQLLGYDDVEVKNPLYRLRIYRWGQLTNRDRRVLPHTWDFTDPSTIPTETAAERAGLDAESITAPTFTGAVLTGTRVETLVSYSGATHTLTINSYGLVTPQQQQENQLTTARADPLHVYVRETASRISSTNTAATIADGLLATNQTDPLFDGVEVKRLTPASALQIIRTTGADKIMLGSVDTREIPRAAIPRQYDFAARRPFPDAFGQPKAWQYIFPDGAYAPPLVNPNGVLTGSVMPQPCYRTQGKFRYRRRRIVLASALDAWYFEDNFGKCNNGYFGRFAAHRLLYSGVETAYCFAISGAHLLTIDYLLDYDNFMFYTAGRLFDGTVHAIDATNGFTVPQYYEPDVFIHAEQTIDWPLAIDFSFLDS